MSHRVTAATVALFLALARTLAAQTPGQTGSAGPVRDTSLRTLCGTPAGAAPAPSVERLQALMSSPSMQRDIAAVLAAAGLESLQDEVRQILSNSTVTDTPQPAGTRIEWIARRVPRPTTAGPFRWSGPAPLEAFGFVIDDLSITYTFIVPKRCAAIALLTREPSVEAARRAEAARAADAAQRAEEAVQARLQAAERERAELKARRDEDVRLAQERAVAEEARLVEETAVAAAAQREQERRLVAEALGADRAGAVSDEPRGVRIFAAPFAGAARHQRTAAANGAWTGVAGGRAGLDVAIGRRWSVRPSLGADVRLDESGYTRLMFDTEVRLSLGPRVTLGSGLSIVDATRSDRAQVGWLATVGTPLGSPAGRLPVRFLVEGQQLFQRDATPGSDYRLLAGLEVRLK